MTVSNDIGLIEKIVHLNRVSKVVKGGKKFKFTALVVVGDGKGKVGYGYGKANQVPDAIAKATDRAKKNMINLPIIDGTIPYPVIGRFGAATVLLKPAVPGTGIIAGGPVRAVMEAAGVTDVLSKVIGSRNPINVIKATISAFGLLRTPEEVSEIRGFEVSIVR